jgi:hypothetical protein
MTILWRTNGVETLVREPGHTADPSAALGMTKGRAVTFIRDRQMGWTEEETAGPLRFASAGMTISFKA